MNLVHIKEANEISKKYNMFIVECNHLQCKFRVKGSLYKLIKFDGDQFMLLYNDTEITSINGVQAHYFENRLVDILGDALQAIESGKMPENEDYQEFIFSGNSN